MKSIKNIRIMKKNFMYAIMSAIALSGAVSFSACQSGDEIIDNPNYNPEDKTVKTEFVINVTQPSERTRQTSTIAGNGVFQGLNDMYLVCFNTTPAPATTITPATHILSISGYPAAELDGTTPTITNSSSKWYTLYIPSGTSNFLFYGKTVSGDPTNPASTGQLTYDIANKTSVGGIEFALSPIASAMTTDETILAGYLNTIAGATGWAGTVALRDGDNTTTPVTPGDVHYKALADAYQQFVSTSTGGVRQGSAMAILSTVGDLYASMKSVSNTETGAPKTVADAVITAIETNFTINTSTGAASFKDASLSTTTTNYPEGLPAGSAILTFNTSTSIFSYTNGGTVGTATIATPMAFFTYPAELAYYCNSALRATTSEVNTSTLPSTSATWVNDGQWTGWSQTAVDGSTRAVAMKENVTYGVAQLQSTISSTVSTFTDNAAAVTTGDGITGNEIANQSIDLSGATDYLKVTGIIIGSQPQVAGYDYLPKSTEGYGYAIYDRVENSGSSAGTVIVGNATTPTASYYTLVLDNYAAPNVAVNVAIEFVASQDFFGKDGLIKKDQPFYLLGELNPAAATNTINWDTHVSFKSGDTGQGTDRVFIRDAKTVATFTLSATSLQNAYSTIPDLRSTQMLFGLSVDLAWKTGLTFNVNL